MGVFHSRPETVECRLTASLALLRVSLGAFLLVWAVMKFVLPKGTMGIFHKFYGVEIDSDIALVLGALQLALAILVIIGLWRTWSYGSAVLVHGFSQSAVWRETLDPWALYINDKPAMLYWAGVPVGAACMVIWLLRVLTPDAWVDWGFAALSLGWLAAAAAPVAFYSLCRSVGHAPLLPTLLFVFANPRWLPIASTAHSEPLAMVFAILTLKFYFERRLGLCVLMLTICAPAM